MSMTEATPLVVAAAPVRYDDRAPPPAKRAADALPRWFLASAAASVVVTLLWMLALVALQQASHAQRKELLTAVGVADADLAPPSSSSSTPSSTSSLHLYAGVLNSLLGSFLSASGYCCQKFAHVRVQRDASLGAASQQRVFLFGLFLLAVGTVSAVLNLGILGQAVQAPFAALTLLYSAVLGRLVLREQFTLSDLGSSVLIVAGVAVDVLAAQLAHVPPTTFTLRSLGALLLRDSVFPAAYTLLALSYTTLLLRHVHSRRLHGQAVGLLAFSSSAGIMAGFTSLATKSTLEVLKAALRHDAARRHHAALELANPFFLLLVAAIPCALVPQLFLLNKGLEFFGTLRFIPLYQAFIILGNTLCGLVYFNEMASYAPRELLLFAGGVLVTLAGVCLQLLRVDTDAPSASSSSFSSAAATETSSALPVTMPPAPSPADPFATAFSFDDMEFAWSHGDVRTLCDFDACKAEIVRLLRSATASIYYSTFLCDFELVLEPATGASFASLLRDAVARGVQVHVLYNPVGDYGTPTLAALRRLLPPRVHLAWSVSDLGPSALTRCFSNNSRYGFHHQKYLCVDGARIMVTGCDVNEERNGWLRRNALGYYWHEVGVVAPCSAKMWHWVRANHVGAESELSDSVSSSGVTRHRRRHYAPFQSAPPFPLVAGGWREENAMVNLILRAQHSVQLENQILISGGSMQHNRVCDALIERIDRAHKAGHEFHVLLLSNAAQQDEPSHVTRFYCTLAVQWSLEHLEHAALQRGLSRETLAQYLLVARLQHHTDGGLIKVHSNLLIVDATYALRSSSNLADRSLSARPTDTELGLLFAGDVVARLQRELLVMYVPALADTLQPGPDAVAQVLAFVRSSRRSCIFPMELKPWSPIWTWFLMNVFVFASEGATGGRVRVTYETTASTVGKTASDASGAASALAG
ncbi:hypothetical protein P43SY_003795 [Pythium insidiosum]|uniref:PLD phosphodiesterase domain-containing protein n=1 Tax=Pythium insidiosum TaxID=114742 RepID=A0AAD5M6A6_PYTIN|nr:hypothetical protein P43SY_003795 [Pythium insidiosum]